MFNKIEDLVSLADAAGMPKTAAQVVNYGIGIIKKTNDFEKALIEWYNLPIHNQTWTQFKQHFTDAQNELRKIRGPKLRDTQFHQANQVSELKADFAKLKDELISSVNALADSQHQEQVQEQEAMNAATGINSAILQLLQQMQGQLADKQPPAQTGSDATIVALLQQMQAQMNLNQSGGNKPSQRRRQRKNISKYCWSHGACSHESKDCKSPRKGHQWNATFENKMKGSEDFCKPCE